MHGSCRRNASPGAFVAAVILCVCVLAGETWAAPDYTLRQVQIVFRHGDRTPMNEVKHAPVTWTCSENTLQSLSDGASVASVNGDRSFRVLPEPGHQILAGNCSAGQLTSVGVAQHQALGAWLRAHYIDDLHFLSGDYQPDAVYIRSTDVPRTIQSVQVPSRTTVG